MEVKFTDSFFKSLKKMSMHQQWWYKIYHFIRYDIFRFFKNIWRFKKELYAFYPWDYTYNLRIFAKSLEITANNVEEYGMEEDVSRFKKIRKMRRAIEILNNITEDKYLDIAEKELGFKVITTFEFEETDDGNCKLKEDTKEVKQNNKKIFDLSRKIEEKQFDELWEIIKGKNRKCPKGVKYDDWFDGSDIRSWWD